MREVIVEVPDNYAFDQEAVSVKGNLTRCKNCIYGRPYTNGIMCDRDLFIVPEDHYCSMAKPRIYEKKDFIVRRSITMIDGKPHVETYSEQPLIRCRDCKYYILDDGGQMACDYDELLRYPEDFYCGNAVRRDET
jgi:hypothetical protein